MNADLLVLRGELVALRPVVADRVGEYLAARVERALRDRSVQLLGGLQFGARVLVPEAELVVRADGGQCAVHRMKRDVVHRVDVLVAVVRVRRPVALEGEVVFRVLHAVHVLDRHATLHAAQTEAARHVLLVAEDRDAARLELQVRVDALVLGRLILQLVDHHLSVRERYGRHRVDHVRTVHALRQVDGEQWLLLLQVPEPQRLVPAAGHQARVGRRFDPVHRLHRRVMLCDLDGLVRVEVPHFHGLVAGGREYFGAVLFSGFV